MSDAPTDLKGMNQSELEKYFVSLGEKPFRGKQMMKWMYQKGLTDFEAMTDFGKPLRKELAREACISELAMVSHHQSEEMNAEKFVFRLHDGNLVESVMMSYEDHLGPSRMTACISTQVGCAMGCRFCASSIGGLVRNLSCGEIIDQVIQLQKLIAPRELRIANIVLMGIGEPLDNFEQVIKTVKLLNNPDGVAVGMRHIAVSTCGIPPRIRAFADEELQAKLALSLHSADNEIRKSLMPVTKKYPLEELRESLRYYQEKTSRRITIEYTLIKGINDRYLDACKLKDYLSGLGVLINLIPLNEVPEFAYERSPAPQVESFKKWLDEWGFRTTVRKERGVDISAACGQLRRKAGYTP